MGKRYLYLFVSIPLLIASCSAPQQDEIEYRPPKFKHEYKVEITKLNEDLLFGNVISMFLQDSVAILYASNADNDNAFQVLSAETGEFVGAFANSGRGRGELAAYIRTAITPDGMKLYSVDNNKMVRYDLAKAISGKPDFIEISKPLNRRNTTLQIHALSDSKILHLESRPRNFVTDTDFIDTLALYNDYPVISEQFTKSGDSLMTRMYFTYHMRSAIKPDRRKLVEATDCGFIMQIFDVSTEKIDLAKTLYFYEPKMRNYISATEGCVTGTVDISSTDKYIYVLYSINPELAADSVLMGVFDWNGKPLDCYSLDHMPYKIAVTPDDKRAYYWVQKEDGEEFFGYVDLKRD